MQKDQQRYSTHKTITECHGTGPRKGLIRVKYMFNKINNIL